MSIDLHTHTTAFDEKLLSGVIKPATMRDLLHAHFICRKQIGSVVNA